MIVDFSPLQTKLVLERLITQVIMPYDDETSNLKKGDVLEVSFGGLLFRDYSIQVCKVSVTSINKMSSKDIFECGFLYKPFFLEFIKGEGFDEDDTILKIDFKLVERMCEVNESNL